MHSPLPALLGDAAQFAGSEMRQLGGIERVELQHHRLLSTDPVESLTPAVTRLATAGDRQHRPHKPGLGAWKFAASNIKRNRGTAVL